FRFCAERLAGLILGHARPVRGDRFRSVSTPCQCLDLPASSLRQIDRLFLAPTQREKNDAQFDARRDSAAQGKLVTKRRSDGAASSKLFLLTLSFSLTALFVLAPGATAT